MGELLLGSVATCVVILGSLNSVLGKIRAKPLNQFDYLVSFVNSLFYTFFFSIATLAAFYLGHIDSSQFKYVFKNRTTHTITNSDYHSLNESENPTYENPISTDTCFDQLWNSLKSNWKSLGAWKYLVATGFMDAAGSILGFVGQPYVPGIIFLIMTQWIVLFTMITSMIILKRRYTIWEFVSMLVVVGGAVVAIIPKEGFSSGTPGSISSYRQCLYYFIIAISTLPNAISFSLKELMFQDYVAYMNEIKIERRSSELSLHEVEESSADLPDNNPRNPTPQKLSIFIVGAVGSFFSIFWSPIALPLNVALGHTKGMPLTSYINDGVRCFLGHNDINRRFLEGCFAYNCCHYAPRAYAVYIGVNMMFNVFLLTLLRMGSALLTFICVKAILPVSVILFVSFSWPLLEEADIGFSMKIIASLIIILSGIICFRFSNLQNKRVSDKYFDGGQPSCLWPLCWPPRDEDLYSSFDTSLETSMGTSLGNPLLHDYSSEGESDDTAI